MMGISSSGISTDKDFTDNVLTSVLLFGLHNGCISVLYSAGPVWKLQCGFIKDRK